MDSKWFESIGEARSLGAGMVRKAFLRSEDTVLVDEWDSDRGDGNYFKDTSACRCGNVQNYSGDS